MDISLILVMIQYSFGPTRPLVFISNSSDDTTYIIFYILVSRDHDQNHVITLFTATPIIALSSGKVELDKIPALFWVTPSILSTEKWTSLSMEICNNIHYKVWMK